MSAAWFGTPRSPRERWGTCCPFDPECQHSYLDEDELTRWFDWPLNRAEYAALEDRR